MNKKVAVYPGSFDPITYGHINIAKRAAKIFDEIVLLILENPEKKCLFSLSERVEMATEVFKNFDNIKVDYYEGLLVDYMKHSGLKIVVRGLRAVMDFEYELKMAHANRSLYPDLEILFLMTDSTNSFISSSMVKEVAMFGGNVNMWVPNIVESKLKEKFQKTKKHKLV